MSRVFVIPDVHLKPWMFEKAARKVSSGKYDAVVMLGDLVDDWGKGKDLDLYNETFDAAIGFIKDFPDTFFCYGNHDVSYLWGAMETGYSFFAQGTVVERLEQLKEALPVENTAFIHRIDDVLFSHAGLTRWFVEDHFDVLENPSEDDIFYIINKVNLMGMDELWQDNSPIWARPQDGVTELYPAGMLQVVGHTPVAMPLKQGNLLTVDVFSTYRNGSPIGSETFVCVDTGTHESYEII